MVRKEFGMEDGNEVGKHLVGFYWSRLVVRRLFHVAVDYMLLLESLEVHIARFTGFQRLV